jgi:hypothetical protein
MAVLGKEVKGGKKGKGKGPELSPAEQALEDKKRRLKENDERKRAAEAQRERLLADMESEAKNTQVNRLRVQNQWRKIMRLAKVESLRKEIEVLSQNHERDVDRKDAIIQMLDRDVEEAEEQYQTALRSHLGNLDRLIDLQDSRLLALENEFESELAEVACEFNAEREQILKQHAAEKRDLVDVVAAVEAEEAEREAEARQEHEQTREEIRNKNLEDINVLRITLESNIEELERHFESAHLNYLQNTDQRTQDFKFLTRKDQELSREIELKIRKIERLQASLQHWRTKIAQNGRECEERNAALRAEKDQIAAHFLQLKSRMNRFRERQARRLTDLTKATAEARAKVAAKLQLAERILKQADLASKLETEQEKVLPFYQSSVLADDTAKPRAGAGAGAGAGVGSAAAAAAAAAADADSGAEAPSSIAALFAQDEPPEMLAKKARAVGPDGRILDEWASLDNFFKRFNKALLSKLAVDKERDRLQEENRALQQLLRQYLDGVSVKPDIMDTANPLLVVNGRINVTGRAKVREASKAINVIDGNHMQATLRTS